MFFKKKVEEPIDPKMFPSFHAHGGYEKDLDIMAWQIGWNFAKLSKENSVEKAFQDLYYGGGSPFPFDKKTFELAWKASRDAMLVI